MVSLKNLVVGAAELGCAVGGAALLATGLSYGLQIEPAEATTFLVPIRLSPLREVAIEEEPVDEPVAFEFEEQPLRRPPLLAAAKQAAVVVDEPAVPPALPEPGDAFRLALRAARPTLERCYENELKKQAPFSGALELAVHVRADGHIDDARVTDGDQKTTQVGQCIAARLRQLKLPPVASEAEVVVPIRLSAVEGL